MKICLKYRYFIPGLVLLSFLISIGSPFLSIQDSQDTGRLYKTFRTEENLHLNIAYNDPLGANGPRVKVQVKHKINTSIPVEQLRAFMSVIGSDEIGIYVSSGGFTGNVWDESRSQDKRKITLIDLDSFVELWIKYYPKLNQEGRQTLPLKPVYFPALSE